jgi:polyhydroxyalkanoate synthesis regulator phasin
MANQDNKSFMDTVIDAQKKVVDSMADNTKKFANGNNMVNETIEKGSDWYKNWLDTQKNMFSKTTEQADKASDTAKDNMSKMNEFYQNWFNTQMGWAKQMWEMNMNHMKNATTANNTTDPMSFFTNAWTNWNNNVNSWMNNMNNTNNWMNMMNQWQSANPFNMEAWKTAGNNLTSIFNQYYEMLNNNFAEWQKNIQNGTVQDAYRNMVNAADGFTRFSEMWAPLWKSIQEKTFNTEMYKQWMNPGMYKDMMDKFFGFMPEQTRQYMQQMTTMMQNGMSQMGQQGMGNYQQMRSMMNNMMPNQADMFGSMMNNYNAWYGMMNNAMSPITKMMTPNQHTKNMMEWNDIANRLAIYNIKNAEMQYMIYNQGVKVMDQLAENVMGKIEKGEEVNSMMALYQEWMNISDKVYVSLFESEEYSKIMAEVSAMQLKLRKDFENQMEKMMVGIPVATRSEMDELYKTIYDLKKQVRELEKANETAVEETTTEEKAARRTTTAKK